VGEGVLLVVTAATSAVSFCICTASAAAWASATFFVSAISTAVMVEMMESMAAALDSERLLMAESMSPSELNSKFLA